MLSEFVRTKLTHFFRLLDQDGDNHLQLEDFSTIAERIRFELAYAFDSRENKFIVDRSVRFFYKLLTEINPKGNQIIALDEWLHYADRQLINADSDEKLEEFSDFMVGFFFDLFDENKDGYISVDEYADLFLIYGIDIKYSGKSFMSLDINKDGRISKTELLFAFETFIASDDPHMKGNWIFGNWYQKVT